MRMQIWVAGRLRDSNVAIYRVLVFAATTYIRRRVTLYGITN